MDSDNGPDPRFNLMGWQGADGQAYTESQRPGIGVTLERIHLGISIEMLITNSITMGILKWHTDLAKYPIPNPYTMQNSADWLAWQVIYPINTGGAAGLHQTNNIVDIRSKRKIEEVDETFWLVVHWGATPTSGVNTERIRVASSTLIKGAYV